MASSSKSKGGEEKETSNETAIKEEE